MYTADGSVLTSPRAPLRLYAYWRSSASYRVRIALNLKGLAYEIVPVHLVRGGGEQHAAEYLRVNPQARVPVLVDGQMVLNQSQAILEYLEEAYPQPALLPAELGMRARVRAFCMTLVADVQPLQNLSVFQYLTGRLGVSEADKNAWARHWIERGLTALEHALGQDDRQDGPFVFGARPTLADCVLVPQIYNAERFDCDARLYPRLMTVAEHCRSLPAFVRAHPDQQPDAGS